MPHHVGRDRMDAADLYGKRQRIMKSLSFFHQIFDLHDDVATPVRDPEPELGESNAFVRPLDELNIQKALELPYARTQG